MRPAEPRPVPPAALSAQQGARYALHLTPQGRVWLLRPRPPGAPFERWERTAATRMLAHGLHDWGFAFGRGKRVLGSTRVRAGARHGTLRVSRHLIEHGSEERILDTLLHEIAHALAYLRFGPSAMNHGPAWRRVAREVGAAPSATCRAAPVAPARYRLQCSACGHEVGLYRRPKHPPSAYRHKGCGGSMRSLPDSDSLRSNRALR